MAEKKEPKLVSLQEIMDMGLLFEINRRVLHPLGMAMAVNIDPNDPEDEGEFGGILDSRDDPEGFIYGDDLMESGLKKFEDYMEREGLEKLRVRQEQLGYIIQGEE